MKNFNNRLEKWSRSSYLPPMYFIHLKMYFKIKLKPFNPYSALLMSHCALHRKDSSLCALTHRLCMSRKGGVTCKVLCTWQLLGLAAKGPWLAPGGPILDLAAWAGLEMLLSLFRGFISGREGFFGSKQAFANQECWVVHAHWWVDMVKVTSLLVKPESALRFIFGGRAQTEIKIWCITGMCMLKVVLSERNLGVKGF